MTSAFLKELILDYRKLSSSHYFNFRFLSLLVIYETFEEKLCRRRRAKWSGSRNCVGFSRGQVKNFLFSTPANANISFVKTKPQNQFVIATTGSSNLCITTNGNLNNEWVASNRILVSAHKLLESSRGKNCRSLERNEWYGCSDVQTNDFGERLLLFRRCVFRNRLG